jgi:hypothetical protein
MAFDAIREGSPVLRGAREATPAGAAALDRPRQRFVHNDSGDGNN